MLIAHDSPCYRCLYPKPPPAATVTNCSDGGVLGMVPGIIGQIQAIEIVKLLLGQPRDNLLCQRMIFFDALSMRFRNVKLRGRNAQCEACGEHANLDPAQFDYEAFCQTKCATQVVDLAPENTMTVASFKSALEEIKNMTEE